MSFYVEDFHVYYSIVCYYRNTISSYTHLTITKLACFYGHWFPMVKCVSPILDRGLSFSIRHIKF